MKKYLTFLISTIILALGIYWLWFRITPQDVKVLEDNFSQAREEMVEKQLKGRDISDAKVLEVMSKVPREKFVPESLKAKAYYDNPLPIGFGQTISQPYIVALMTESLKLDSDDKVLEIGTGSGYQAAVLAEITPNVFTIEIVEELASQAKDRLKKLGYDSVLVKHADGYFGWEEKAPFDKIIVTAATNHTPPPLIEQLKEGGKLIIPLGSTLGFQNLTLITKVNGELESEVITSVRFVPLTGKAKE